MVSTILRGVAWVALAACQAEGALAAPAIAPIPAAATRPTDIAPKGAAMAPIANPPRQVSGGRRRKVRGPAEDPLARVARANAVARVQPRLEAYANAAQVYAFSEGALYQVYVTPGRVTDIVLQAQEKLSETGPVAAGDTTRWVIGDTKSGSGPDQRVHILVKPTRADLRTNLVINTDRRTYHLELRATDGAYMAAVSWRYPLDEARAAAAAEQARRAAEVHPYAERAKTSAPAALNFGYRISGRADWRPVRVYDDGRQTFIEFPPSVAQGEMPPIFVGSAGRATELVNYRVQGRRMIVDRIFDTAELRLGDRRGQQRVRILRTGEEGP